MKEVKTKLDCAVCGEGFDCEHDFSNEFNSSEESNVPHCQKCFYDNGLCEHKHGYQCSKHYNPFN